MPEDPQKIDELLKKLESLIEKQNGFEKEIHMLRHQVIRLKSESKKSEIPKTEIPEVKSSEPPELIEDQKEILAKEEVFNVEPPPLPPKETQKKPSFTERFNIQSDLEKFVGENLINKIGIIIIVLGTGIGVKLAIDNELISPTMRVVLGYLVGFGLLGFAIRLKEKYTNFSAVLLSGAMAILYFITFAAHSFYDLIPVGAAFAVMVFFTLTTVVAALNYDRQVIALLGLVGAYTIPFLLSQGSGAYLFLFAYMAIINTGILAVSVWKYWKPLLYSAFTVTWLIYSALYGSASWSFEATQAPTVYFIFATVFFLIFYLTALSYKLIKKEKFALSDILFIILNSFVFYGFGYMILDYSQGGDDYLGLFTAANAVIHFIVASVVYRSKLGDRNLFYFVSALVLVFLTIAIPVQLDGNWVTLIWAGEAAILFWIGRTKNVPVYEYLSFPLIFLAVASIFHDWTTEYQSSLTSFSIYNPEYRFQPLFNIHFLTSVLVIAAFGWINVVHQKNIEVITEKQRRIRPDFYFILPIILIATIYFSFVVEIENAWIQLYAASELIFPGDEGVTMYDDDLLLFKSSWGINYTMVFMILLSLVNTKIIKNKLLGLLILVGSGLVIASFLSVGLDAHSGLRNSFMTQDLVEYYSRTWYHILIRYASIGIALTLITMSYKTIKTRQEDKSFLVVAEVLLAFVILVLTSRELIHWLEMAGVKNVFEFGVSILWGIYALMLIGLGIWKRKKHLRIGAMVLLGLTLLKLFFYDMANLETISKTIVMVSLGILLLVVSFLYNKYTDSISGNEE